ncbi:hypothetical protein QBC33DRAFT_92210 [Phialemonium atrogriseum]|uniref:SigF-like NTF2-like domain-containing protein n=1 Tax=Phialemonium atrogriseum TaxID=1093897 RepID=A0AAJ0C1A3_9PEZI|nr:uncharacterized protein QBC33DRAFT_92210 [Phialemonium atrogriseum]KAK1766879.1 hypothetical protein QBC33DRAFT_92210 [Phialemonium atrogriseum]
MENPATEIPAVIYSLTYGTQQQQLTTLSNFFLEDASFVHPFVRVPSFSRTLPVLGVINSRMVISAIYRWYRMMSPIVHLAIESSAFDRTNNIMYVTISQRFAIWFIPFYVANVRLVSVLHLHQYQQQSGASVNGNNNGQGDNQDGGAPMVPVTRYRIGRQEDQYQINEWLKFILPGLGSPIWAIWQVLCAGLCFFLATLFTLLPALARLPMMAVHLLQRICRTI